MHYRTLTKVQPSPPHRQIWDNVITEAEEESLVSELEQALRRKRYNKDHWDAVIINYKETERLQWLSRDNAHVVERIRAHLEREVEALTVHAHTPWLPVHVVDLEGDGYITPHVDSVKFSGEVVAGLSLLSPAVMALTLDPEVHDARGVVAGGACHMCLPRRSLYAISGPARYDYAHSIAPPSDSTCDDVAREVLGEDFHRGRRISLIFRDAKHDGEERRGMGRG